MFTTRIVPLAPLRDLVRNLYAVEIKSLTWTSTVRVDSLAIQV